MFALGFIDCCLGFVGLGVMSCVGLRCFCRCFCRFILVFGSLVCCGCLFAGVICCWFDAVAYGLIVLIFALLFFVCGGLCLVFVLQCDWCACIGVGCYWLLLFSFCG